MLVTVYQKLAGGWQATRCFYRFARDRIPRIDPDPDLPSRIRPKKPRYVCPGCELQFTEVALESHICFGGARGYPRIATTGRSGRPMNNLLRNAQQRQPD
jgi:hypothetical protein